MGISELSESIEFAHKNTITLYEELTLVYPFRV